LFPCLKFSLFLNYCKGYFLTIPKATLRLFEAQKSIKKDAPSKNKDHQLEKKAAPEEKG
jgi:hypothetical protein